MRRVIATAMAAACFASLAVGCSNRPAAAVRSDLPRRIAAAGDSVTRAFNVGSCCSWTDAPEYSWATGDRLAVDSDFNRLHRLDPRIREFNVAQTGPTMAAPG